MHGAHSLTRPRRVVVSYYKRFVDIFEGHASAEVSSSCCIVKVAPSPSFVFANLAPKLLCEPLRQLI
jgi:hypothetical protein